MAGHGKIRAERKVNRMGMTDLQFKAYLRLLIRALERIESQDTAEQMREELKKFRQDLESTLRG